MALLQIGEPGADVGPHKKNLVIGIDLGTTNSLVASNKSGITVILKDNFGNALIPSVVNYAANSTSVGVEAVNKRITDPKNTIVSIKRLLGKNPGDLPPSFKEHYSYHILDNNKNIIEVTTAAGAKNPIQISSDILKYLKDIAVANLGDEPVGAVITVPAYFNDGQRQATKQAAELAGLKVLRLLSEPTAAALAYGLDSKNEGIFMVYDLGGGTLDVSILRFNHGIFEVLAVNGNTYLGGDDFDTVVYNYILQQLSNTPPLNPSENAQILLAAKHAKEELSNNTETRIRLNINQQDHEFIITEQDFFAASNNLVKQAMLPIKQALRDANLDIQDINEVILVGGATRMPHIRQSIASYFAKPPLTSIDPDQVVALGAAIQADILAGNSKDDWLLLDVTPLSLGIETMGGLVEKIIPRNSTIPITRAQEFTTYQDGQTAMSIHVVQGERELVNDCRSLAKFSLKGIPPLKAGGARIKVTFQIDADGLLSVSASEQTTATTSSIEVKPSFGLSPDEIKQMLASSIDFAKNDIDQRLLKEAQIDANSLITAAKNAIAENTVLLNLSEQREIEQAIANLTQALNVTIDIKQQTLQIRELSKTLNHKTERLAAQIMDNAIKYSLTGKEIKKL